MYPSNWNYISNQFHFDKEIVLVHPMYIHTRLRSDFFLRVRTVLWLLREIVGASEQCKSDGVINMNQPGYKQ